MHIQAVFLPLSHWDSSADKHRLTLSLPTLRKVRQLQYSVYLGLEHLSSLQSGSLGALARFVKTCAKSTEKEGYLVDKSERTLGSAMGTLENCFCAGRHWITSPVTNADKCKDQVVQSDQMGQAYTNMGCWVYSYKWCWLKCFYQQPHDELLHHPLS